MWGLDCVPDPERGPSAGPFQPAASRGSLRTSPLSRCKGSLWHPRQQALAFPLPPLPPPSAQGLAGGSAAWWSHSSTSALLPLPWVLSGLDQSPTWEAGSRPGFASQEKSLEVKREAPFPQQSRPMPLELPGLAWPLVGAVILPHWEVTQENSALLQAGAQAARPPPWSCWHPISARLPPDVVPAWPCLALTALSRHTLEAPPDGGPQQPRASCGFSAPLVPHSWGPSHPLFAREPLCAAPASLSLRRPVRPKPSESPIYTQPGLLPPAGLCRYTIVGLQEAPASVSLASPPNGPLRLPDWCTHKTRSCTEMLMAFCCGGKQSGPGDKAPSQALPQRPGPTPSRH
ncbi:uncharacterized protein LOC125091962 isoform X2 [Lutra lutra]|nr:uncharacterized protein LOC125091962 isoform X2 [Lutra lutra]